MHGPAAILHARAYIKRDIGLPWAAGGQWRRWRGNGDVDGVAVSAGCFIKTKGGNVGLTCIDVGLRGRYRDHCR